MRVGGLCDFVPAVEERRVVPFAGGIMDFKRISVMKYEKYIVVFILIVGFLFRLQAASAIHLVHDEKIRFEVAETISLDPKDPHLPIGSDKANHPLLTVYMVKSGLILFGEGALPGRIPFVCLGTLSLLLMYLLTREGLGRRKAVLATIFLCLSPYHIGWSRLAVEDSGLLFFGVLPVYTFFRGIGGRGRKLVLLTGIALGVGYLAKMTVFILIPIFFLYVLISKKYKYWFKRSELYIALIIALLIISPTLYWNMLHGWANYRMFLHKISGTGARVSFHALFLYLGDLFRVATFLAERSELLRAKMLAIPGFGVMWDEVQDWQNEYPAMCLALGVLGVFGAVYSWKARRLGLVRLFLLIFWVDILAASFLVRPWQAGEWVMYFEQYWWASLSVMPAVVLGAHALEDLRQRFSWIWVVQLLLVLYLAWNSWCFIHRTTPLFFAS